MKIEVVSTLTNRFLMMPAILCVLLVDVQIDDFLFAFNSVWYWRKIPLAEIQRNILVVVKLIWLINSVYSWVLPEAAEIPRRRLSYLPLCYHMYDGTEETVHADKEYDQFTLLCAIFVMMVVKGDVSHHNHDWHHDNYGPEIQY